MREGGASVNEVVVKGHGVSRRPSPALSPLFVEPQR